MNIVILAAGQGKRMRSPLPKVLHRVAGQAMLARVIATARQTASLVGQTARIVVVVGHGADQVRQALATQPDLQFVDQHQQLGTGHAVMQALPCLDDSHATLVLYGDVPLIGHATLQHLISNARDGVGILSVMMPDPRGYGRILRHADGGVEAIIEEKDASPEQRGVREVNTGIMIVPTSSLRRWLSSLTNQNAQGEYYLTDIVAAARAEGASVSAYCSPDVDETRGVNSKVQLAELERIAQWRMAQALLEAGVQLADPARIDVRGSLVAGQDVSVDVGCVFEGEVSLANGVQVEPYCVLRNCQIGEGTRIQAFTHIDGAAVGAGVVLGPYARLRPGARLDDQVHVGNFVEIKASHLHAGTKANHLTYVGDAEVGPRTNIGAGTIFANYDGVNKHRTTVGADVQIGSNTVLVAPMTIADGATVGAGSTVTHTVPEGVLTVARARQTTIAGWQRPRKKNT
jgi:bifunctional UDP-N-acetylglucosamine pyrophosphorylase/glucosamine-1-phosphate N-acetyltransferase